MQRLLTFSDRSIFSTARANPVSTSSQGLNNPDQNPRSNRRRLLNPISGLQTSQLCFHLLSQGGVA